MNKEIYVPGSEWITYKFYTGTQVADGLLVDKIYPVVKKLLSKGSITQFFFLRYVDPEFHLRVRVKVAGPELLGDVLEAFVPTLVKCCGSGLISNVVIDTYVPESERYGAATMELTEELFFIDSRSVVELLKLLRRASDNDRHRWLLSAMMIRDTLDCFFNDEQAKADVMAGLAAGFKNEHGFTTKHYTKQLNDKYRNYSELISLTLSGNNPDMDNYKRALVRRKKRILELTARNGSLIEANKKQWTANFTSVMHMTMNRLFKTNNRLFEMVVYEFMSKYQASQLARVKYQAAPGAGRRPKA